MRRGTQDAARRLLSMGTAREFFHTVRDNVSKLHDLLAQCRLRTAWSSLMRFSISRVEASDIRSNNAARSSVGVLTCSRIFRLTSTSDDISISSKPSGLVVFMIAPNAAQVGFAVNLNLD